MTYGSERLQDHERREVAELYARYACWLKSHLVRRYGVQDAEDFIQETWLKITPLRGAGDIRHPKSFLLRVAANLAATTYGRRRRTATYSTETHESSWGFEMPCQTEQVLVRQIVLSLPQPLRDVFVLSRVGGLSNAQIAQQLGISPKTVEWRMTKALAHCAAQLRR